MEKNRNTLKHKCTHDRSSRTTKNARQTTGPTRAQCSACVHQERGQDLRVSFLDFVAQDYAVGPPPNGLRQLATLVVARICHGGRESQRNG